MYNVAENSFKKKTLKIKNKSANSENFMKNLAFLNLLCQLIDHYYL